MWAGNFISKVGNCTSTTLITAIYCTNLGKFSLNAGAYTTGDNGTHDMSGVTIGADEVPNNYLVNGSYVCEFLIFGGHLAPSVVTLIKTYLNTKWAIY